MFGAISVFDSSESADTDEYSSEDHVDTEKGESDDEDASEIVLAPRKTSKLTTVEKAISMFSGRIYCVYFFQQSSDKCRCLQQPHQKVP